jgi:carboxypeptidase C (cathepsin A)
MIFIEQPAGVGFSVAEGNVSYGDEEVLYNSTLGYN